MLHPLLPGDTATFAVALPLELAAGEYHVRSTVYNDGGAGRELSTPPFEVASLL